LQIKEKYVDPTRVNPNAMLVHGLDELQKTVPEVVITFDKALDETPTQAVVQVNTQTKTFAIPKFESLWEMSFKLKEVFKFIQDNLEPREDLKLNEVEYAVINGMLNTLDPHSSLLSPEFYKDMQTQTGGKFGGLGIVIGIRDGGLTVISPIDNTPASRAGIKSGDKILRIDDESTVNMELDDAVDKMRGDPDTQVTIFVSRNGWNEPKKLTLTRAIIKIESVESQLLSNKVGYVKIKNFQANTHSDLVDQLDKLKKQAGGLNGLVLDLRGNPGGLLDQAIKISDTFLKEGTIVSTVGFGNKLREENKAHASNTEPDYPIVVLVDPGSASASEIVSGALKNLNRAIIVGDTTFGKGSVQVIYDLSDGSAVKLTIAQYLTPGDISIQSVGITPDIQLLPVTVDAKGADLFQPEKITREADLDAHLNHDTAKKGAPPSTLVRYLEARPPEFDPKKPIEDEEKFKEDFPIKFAQKLLKATGTTFSRPEFLQKIKPTIEQSTEQELKPVAEELAKFGVDWSQGDTPKDAKLGVQITTNKPGNAVQAGDKVEVTATVTNNGPSPVYRLHALSDSDNGFLYDREFIFGKLNPGESKSWKVEIEIPKHAVAREDAFKLKFGSGDMELPTQAQTKIKTTPLPAPHFAFLYHIDDTAKGNGDGVLQPGESASMKLRVTNTGAGASEKTSAYLRNLSKADLFLTKGRTEPLAIPAGQEQLFEFTFDVKAVPEQGLKVGIEIYDETFKTFSNEEILLPAQPAAKLKLDAVKGALDVSSPLPLYASPLPDAPQVALAPQGSKLAVTAKVGDRYRVALDGGFFAWASVQGGNFKNGDASPSTKIPPTAFRTAPSVKLDDAQLTTKQDRINLHGTISDDRGVKDYYVYVFNDEEGRNRSRKIAYRPGKDGKLDINTDVPLLPGMNHIRFFVRDTDDMTTTQSVYVYRE
jgi:carboxyl-terminal processing protease